MKIKYLQRKVDELVVCLEQVEKRDFKPIADLAHQIKGNAATFEFPLLAGLGVSLETAALAENPVRTKEILLDMQRAVGGFLRGALKKQS